MKKTGKLTTCVRELVVESSTMKTRMAKEYAANASIKVDPKKENSVD
jgi:hypothetical protein